MEVSQLYNWRKSLSMPIVNPISTPVSLSDLDSLLTETISEAAQKCLELNQNEVCTTLSGGLDSSFCLAKIRETVGPRVKINTFTIGWDKSYPDVRFARQAAGIFNTIHHELIPYRRDIDAAQAELAILRPKEAKRLGNVAVFMVYRQLKAFNQRCVIAHDGIDELLGGYWEHRRHLNQDDQTKAFIDLWARLEDEHLEPLSWKAKNFSVNVILPYLHPRVVSYLTKIPLAERTSRMVSKIPLRKLAEKYLPSEIIERQKFGFCSALGDDQP